MRFLWTAVPTLYKKSVRFNHSGLGAVDAKHLDLWTGPEDARMLHFPPGSLLSSMCNIDVGEVCTWPGPAHFLRGASACLPVDRTNVGGRRGKQNLSSPLWAFLGRGAGLCSPLDIDSPVATARRGVLAILEDH